MLLQSTKLTPRSAAHPLTSAAGSAGQRATTSPGTPRRGRACPAGRRLSGKLFVTANTSCSPRRALCAAAPPALPPSPAALSPPPEAPRGLAGLSFVRPGRTAAELPVPGAVARGARCPLGAQGAGAAARPPRMSRCGARADDGTPHPRAPAASCQRRQGEYPALHLRPDQTCLPVLQDQVSARGRGAGRGETKRRTRAVVPAAAWKTTSSPGSAPAPQLALLLTKAPNLPSNGVLPPRPPKCIPAAVFLHLSPLPPRPSPRFGGPGRLQCQIRE